MSPAVLSQPASLMQTFRQFENFQSPVPRYFRHLLVHSSRTFSHRFFSLCDEAIHIGASAAAAGAGALESRADGQPPAIEPAFRKRRHALSNIVRPDAMPKRNAWPQASLTRRAVSTAPRDSIRRRHSRSSGDSISANGRLPNHGKTSCSKRIRVRSEWPSLTLGSCTVLSQSRATCSNVPRSGKPASAKGLVLRAHRVGRLGGFPSLAGVDPGGDQLARIVSALSGTRQRHLGIRAQAQTIFPTGDLIAQAPPATAAALADQRQAAAFAEGRRLRRGFRRLERGPDDLVAEEVGGWHPDDFPPQGDAAELFSGV